MIAAAAINQNIVIDCKDITSKNEITSSNISEVSNEINEADTSRKRMYENDLATDQTVAEVGDEPSSAYIMNILI